MIKNRLIRNTIIKLHAQSNCKRATYLIEKKVNVRLPVREWLEMQAHLAICPLCTLYKEQSKILQRAIASIFQRRSQTTIAMDRHVKEALEKLVNDKLNDSRQ